MKSFWGKYKEILCKSIAFAAFYVVLVGVGMAAFSRVQVSGAGTETPTTPTVTTPIRDPEKDKLYKLAASSTDGKLTVEIDWENQDMRLTSTEGDEYFYISDAKQKAWDEVDAKIDGKKSVAYSDLSWITKAYELNIRRDKDLNTVVKVTIEAPRTLKAKFAIVNEKPTLNLTMTSTVDKKKITADLTEQDKASVQWRKGATGVWQAYNTLNLEDFMTKGATLNLRLKGECNTEVAKCQMPSKVASVKVTKKANAPSVKVDASKLNLGVKKGQQYILSVPSVPTTTSITTITDNSAAKPNLDQLIGNVLKAEGKAEVDGYEKKFPAFSIKVRTAPTEKKSASKWTVISYPEQREITPGALTVKLLESGKGATLQNNTTYDIEYMIPETNLIQTVMGAKIDAKTRWSTVKAGKTGKTKVSTLTIGTAATGDTAATPGTAIFIRYAAVKENAKTGQRAELASVVGITRATK